MSFPATRTSLMKDKWCNNIYHTFMSQGLIFIKTNFSLRMYEGHVMTVMETFLSGLHLIISITTNKFCYKLSFISILCQQGEKGVCEKLEIDMKIMQINLKYHL